MHYTIIHNIGEYRFEMQKDGFIAYVEYHLADNSLDILHTWVPEPMEGQGIAGALVKAAYDYARENGMKSKATCSYAVAWLKKHPEYVNP